MNKQKIRAILYAVTAAVFYALNMPCSKILLERVPSTVMAPFVGAFLSFVVLKEELSLRYLAALIIMLAGSSLATADTLMPKHRE